MPTAPMMAGPGMPMCLPPWARLTKTLAANCAACIARAARAVCSVVYGAERPGDRQRTEQQQQPARCGVESPGRREAAGLSAEQAGPEYRRHRAQAKEEHRGGRLQRI